MKQNCVTFANDHMLFCGRHGFGSWQDESSKAWKWSWSTTCRLHWVPKPVYVHHLTVLCTNSITGTRIIHVTLGGATRCLLYTCTHRSCDLLRVVHIVLSQSPDPILMSVDSLHTHRTSLRSFPKLSKTWILHFQSKDAEEDFVSVF